MDHSHLHPHFLQDSLASWGDRGGGVGWGVHYVSFGGHELKSPEPCRIRTAPLEERQGGSEEVNRL